MSRIFTMSLYYRCVTMHGSNCGYMISIHVFYFRPNSKHRSAVITDNGQCNQMHALLLFVCSKMADETSRSSKQPVTDITTQI